MLIFTRDRVRSLVASRSGGVAIIFALCLPVALLFVAIAISYAHTLSVKNKTQVAIDAAALGAAAALQTGAALTTQDAQTVATDMFNANAPSAVVSAGTFTPVASIDTSGNVAITATYNGSTPWLFSGVLNSASTNFSSAATATATLGSVAAGSIDGDSGAGGLWGDPHIGGMDGVDFYIACSQPSGSWYNYISDMKFEINISCFEYQNSGVDSVGSVTVLFGPHVLTMSSSPAIVDAYGNMTYDSNAYYGNFVLDGVNHPAVQNLSWVTVYKDADYEVDVHVVTTSPSDGNNFIKIITPTYFSEITFDPGSQADIHVYATNAGRCGAPAGILGQTFLGNHDSNSADFAVAGPTATASNFAQAICNSQSQSARLVK